jgi:hypothetical protein
MVFNCKRRDSIGIDLDGVVSCASEHVPFRWCAIQIILLLYGSPPRHAILTELVLMLLHVQNASDGVNSDLESGDLDTSLCSFRTERALRPFTVGRPRLQPSVWSDAMRKRTTTMTTTLGVAHHDVYTIAKSVHSISKSHTISCLDPRLRRLVSRLSPNRSDVCQRRRGRHDPRAADWLRPRASGVVGPVIRCVPHAAPTKETCRRRPRLRALQCVQAEGSGRAADTLATSRADYRACRTLVRR